MFLIKAEEGFRSNITDGFGFFTFLFRRDHARMWFPDMRRKVVHIGKPEAVEEVIKSRSSGGIAGAEAAEDGVEGRGFQKAGPVRNGYDVHHDGEQKGAEHAGGLSRRGTEKGIAGLHEGVSEFKVQREDPVIDLLIPFAEAGINSSGESLAEKVSDT